MTTTEIEILNAKIDALSGAMAKIDALTGAVQALCAQTGTRLSRQQLAARLGVHRNTLSNMLARDRRMPRPGNDGKWLLSDIIKWENERER